jgi:type VI secretion system secreted protein Hcp
MAQVDYFLKIEGVDGESTDDKHKGEIDIHSFSWGATNTGTHGSGGGGGAGKVQFQDLHFHTSVSKASPKLMLSCATGEHLKKATLTVRKAGKDQQEYYKVTLSDVLVSSYTSGGGGGEIVPGDQFSLNFGKIEFEYKPQKADGTLDAAVKAGWDVATNKKV